MRSIGDVLVAQGNLPEALKSFPRRAGDQRAAGARGPRQRRLAARSVGVVREGRRRAGGAGQSARGAEILSRRARDQPSGWRAPTPATPAGSAICRCRTIRVGDVLVAQGNLPEALKSFRDGLAICRAAGARRPRQRRLAARSVGVLRSCRRRAGGAGQSARGAEILPRRAGDQRAAGARRPRQRRLAARSVGVVRSGRRRAGGAGQSARGAEILPRPARDCRTAGARRPRQRRLAARSVGVATIVSATCWWRRAICPRR